MSILTYQFLLDNVSAAKVNDVQGIKLSSGDRALAIVPSGERESNLRSAPRASPAIMLTSLLMHFIPIVIENTLSPRGGPDETGVLPIFSGCGKEVFSHFQV